MNEVTKIEEVQEVETAEVEETGKVYVLTKPASYNNETITELHFDFESVTGKTCLQIEREMQRLGLASVAPEFSTDYQIRLAVQACAEPIGVDFLESLPAKDFNAIRRMARSFLLR